MALVALAGAAYVALQLHTTGGDEVAGLQPCGGPVERCVVDGDTLRFGEARIRLQGMDAPEMGQYCRMDGRRYACGRAARRALVGLISNRSVSCRAHGEDRYGRTVATCFADGQDVGDAMVRRGWALAYRRYSTAYVAAEREARRAGRGMWRGQFTEPWQWRHSR